MALPTFAIDGNVIIADLGDRAFAQASILVHPVLDTLEFKGLAGAHITDQQLSDLNGEPGSNTREESNYVYQSKCFQAAEQEAATQLCARVKGKSALQITIAFGRPEVKMGVVPFWKSPYNTGENWIYFLGYSSIPVHLSFEGDKCIDARILTKQERDDITTWNTIRFSTTFEAHKNDVHRIGNFEFKYGNPEGKTRAEILALFGEPRDITHEDGRLVYVYGLNRGWSVRIPFENDRAYGRISHCVMLGCPPRKQKNVLRKDYSLHPILLTKCGEHCGTVSEADLLKLASSSWQSGLVSFDPNYLIHEKAELDAADQLCKLALAGKLNVFRPVNLDPELKREVYLPFGFNAIPVRITYSGFDCVQAVCGNGSVPRDQYLERLRTKDSPISVLRHPIFDTEEFASLGSLILTDSQLTELNADPGASDFYSYEYIGSSNCFRTSECEAAQQFCQRTPGRTQKDIVRMAGEPSVKTGPVPVWGDADKFKENWVYYFGYSGIPLRLVFEGDRCVGSTLLSELQQHNFFEWNLQRFSTAREPEDRNRKHFINGYEISCGNPEGKTREEILRIFGEPQLISKDSDNHLLYVYGTGRFARIEIPFVNDIAYGRISHLIRVGWTRRKNK